MHVDSRPHSTGCQRNRPRALADGLRFVALSTMPDLGCTEEYGSARLLAFLEFERLSSHGFECMNCWDIPASSRLARVAAHDNFKLIRLLPTRKLPCKRTCAGKRELGPSRHRLGTMWLPLGSALAGRGSARVKFSGHPPKLSVGLRRLRPWFQFC